MTPLGVAMSEPAIKLTFSDTGDFVAESRAVAALEDCGFSVARMQAHAPRGILFGLYDIQKWKNLNAEHRRALHGIMTGDMRNGPVVVEIFETAPDAAKRRLRSSAATIELAAGQVRRDAPNSRSQFSQTPGASRR